MWRFKILNFPLFIPTKSRRTHQPPPQHNIPNREVRGIQRLFTKRLVQYVSPPSPRYWLLLLLHESRNNYDDDVCNNPIVQHFLSAFHAFGLMTNTYYLQEGI